MSPFFQPRPHIIPAERKPQSHSGQSSKGQNFILTFPRAVLVWRVCEELLPNLMCMRSTWNAVQKMKNRMSTYNYMCNFTGVSFYTSRAIKVYANNNMENKTSEINNISLFLALFTELITHVCLHKQRARKFLKFLCRSMSSLPEKALKENFLYFKCLRGQRKSVSQPGFSGLIPYND